LAQDAKAPEPQFTVVTDRRTASAAVRFYRIRDFEKLQHYKDRALVWVKLYVEQLDDYEFIQLPDAVKYHVHALMLLAARSGNKIPNDPLWVAARIGASDPVDLQLLFARGFLEEWRPRPQDAYEPGEQLELPADGQAPTPAAAGPNPSPPAASGPDSNLLATCYQVASKLLAQNRTEQSREDTDTDTAPASAERLCECCGVGVRSEFSLPEAAELVRHWKAEGRRVGGRPVENVYGLARTIHREGTADDELRLLLRPPPRRPFADEPCPTCFGGKLYTPEPGKGAKPCPDCVDETGRRTGRRALDTDAAGRPP
jgi:hypothetical protein